MIIPNGELWREEPKGEMEIDPETGYPSVREGGWSDKAIQCQVVPLSMDLLLIAQRDGSPLEGAEYQVLVDIGDWSFEGERPTRVRITSWELGINGKELEIRSVKPWRAVEQVEIIV